MKREIKFRAWDGVRMYYFNNHAYTLEYNDISGWNVVPNIPNYRGEYTTGESARSAGSFTLMQYTEIVDIKGREIYDGDIANVTFPNRGFVRAVFEWNETKWSYKILFPLDGSINSKPLYSHPYPHHSDSYAGYRFEIVGNIYENPELMQHGNDNRAV